MQSGLGLDGSEFLSMLGLGTGSSSGDSPPNAKGAKGSGKASKKAVKGLSGSGKGAKGSGKALNKSGKGGKQLPAIENGESAGGDDDSKGAGKPPKTRAEKAMGLARGMVSEVNKRVSDLSYAEQQMKGQKSAASLITEVKECHGVLVSLLELVRKHVTCKQSAFDANQCVTDGNQCVRKLNKAKELLSKAKPYYAKDK